MESGITRNKIYGELIKSPHRNLEEYVPSTQAAAKSDPEFLARLISWNRTKGQIRDAQTALPVISLSVKEFSDAELVENSLASLLALGPRGLAKAVRFSKQVKTPGHGRAIRRAVERFLRNLEADASRFDRVAIQHRDSLKMLYGFPYTGGSLAPSDYANIVLNGRDSKKVPTPYPAGSLRTVLGSLKTASPSEAVGLIVGRKLPFLVASGALGARVKEPEILMALIEQMTPAELTNNMKSLEKAGVRQNPVLRSALDAALLRSANSAKGSALKMEKAADAVDDAEIKQKIEAAKEKKLANMGIEGDWLVIADKSGSMNTAIDLAKNLSATLARLVKGKVHLVFVDTAPTHYDVTGKTLDEIKLMTRHVTAGGGTSLGVGITYAVDRGFDVDGIAVVTDGGENTSPLFAPAYDSFRAKFGSEPPVYAYMVNGDGDALSPNCARAGLSIEKFDANKMDYYSLPNVVQTMRTSRFSLVDEIMEWPLLTIDRVLGGNRRAAAN